MKVWDLKSSTDKPASTFMLSGEQVRIRSSSSYHAVNYILDWFLFFYITVMWDEKMVMNDKYIKILPQYLTEETDEIHRNLISITGDPAKILTWYILSASLQHGYHITQLGTDILVPCLILCYDLRH